MYRSFSPSTWCFFNSPPPFFLLYTSSFTLDSIPLWHSGGARPVNANWSSALITKMTIASVNSGLFLRSSYWQIRLKSTVLMSFSFLVCLKTLCTFFRTSSFYIVFFFKSGEQTAFGSKKKYKSYIAVTWDASFSFPISIYYDFFALS